MKTLKMTGIKLSCRIILVVVLLSACTNGFEKINTNPNGVDDMKIGLENKLQFPQENLFPSDANMYQYWRSLHIDIFAGYYTAPHNFGNNHNGNYRLREDFNHGPFENYFLNVLPYTNRYIPICKELEFYDYAAVTLIVQVMGMLQVVDTYGPANYRSIKEHAETLYYDSDRDIYTDLIDELRQSIQWLEDFLESNPSTERLAGLAKFDRLCGGSHTRWLRLANTMCLRIAMHMAKAEPARAKDLAEKAVNNKYGVFIDASDDILLSGGNPIWTVDVIYGDSRMNASIESILKGYGDPRMEKWFTRTGRIVNNEGTMTLKPDSTCVGIRQGLLIETKSPLLYLNFSSSTYQSYDPRPVMHAAEAWFLRAEGALRGWHMGESAQNCYEQGVRVALSSYGISHADEYLSGANAPDNGTKAANYIDYHDSFFNTPGINNISVTWHEKDTKEQKLQRIITQKWLAIYPDSFEAWTEFRRTGYPRLFPVVYNLSGGLIDTELQIRRLPFTRKEYNTNGEEVKKAIRYLKGADTGGTRLWWDIAENDNFPSENKKK